jgi:hypothetical protein
MEPGLFLPPAALVSLFTALSGRPLKLTALEGRRDADDSADADADADAGADERVGDVDV